MDINDLKVGQIVSFPRNFGPSASFSSEDELITGEIVCKEELTIYPFHNCVLLKIKGGWKTLSAVDASKNKDLVYSKLNIKQDDDFGGWFLSPIYIRYVVSDTNTASEKARGGNCNVCNEFNQYQDGPYTCYRHKC